MQEARDLFRRNLEALRSATGLPMQVVAAHGDFMNRRLGILNSAILADEAFRRDVGVVLETYDNSFMRHVTSRHADMQHPTYWAPEDPRAALVRLEPVVYLLVHPRPWHVVRAVNARDDLLRAWESLRHATGPARRAR